MQELKDLCTSLPIDDSQTEIILSIVEKYRNEPTIIRHIYNVILAEKNETFFSEDHFSSSLAEKQLLNYQITQDVSRIISTLYPVRVTKDTIGLKNELKHQINKNEAVQSLNDHGYYKVPFLLEENTVDSIINGLSPLKFYMRNSIKKVKGYHPNKAEQIKSNTAWIDNQQDIMGIKQIQDIVRDQQIVTITNDYLQASPIHVQTNCWWSKCYDGSKNSLSANAQLFHQDKEFIKFLKVFIYLNDVDESNGAHVYVDGSHKHNPFSRRDNYSISSRVSDEDIYAAFDQDAIITMTGKKGTILLEDTSGFHKGMPVKKGHRLLLQIEYANSLYFNPVPSFGYHNLSPNYNEFLNDNPRFSQNYNNSRYLTDIKRQNKKRFVKNIKGAIKNKITSFTK